MKSLRPLQLVLVSIIVAGILFILVIGLTGSSKAGREAIVAQKNTAEWKAPDIRTIPATAEGELVRYGRELVARTSFYLGPRGAVAAITNGMNCQNCHLDAGTRYWGNNYSAVASTYPRFRNRSGSIENFYKRVNDCLERSLNASQRIDSSSREMQAIVAYFKWLGKDVPKEVRPRGAGIRDLAVLPRAADPVRGEAIYVQHCRRCHGARGEGLPTADSTGYTYPPLWGEKSYTTAAGLYRLSRFAGFVRHNMPFDAPGNSRLLTDEEAWDVAAFVNSRPRPERSFKEDWPDISQKPFDHPFGPYSDGFPETQHKYGPFAPIRVEKQGDK